MVDSLFKMFKLKLYIVFLVYPKFSKFLDVVFGRLFWLCHWHRENWDCKVRHFQKEISRENTTRREVIQRTKVTIRDSTPAAAHPISQKVHDFFLQSNNLFQGNAAMPFCFFVFLCLFHPFSIQSIAQRGILCVCLTVEPLHRFDLMFRVSFDNCTTCVPSSARAARTARTKVTDGYRL